MKINFSAQNLIPQATANMAKQLNFAAAKSLTQTAAAIKQATPARLEQKLDKPTPFTKSGVFVQPARRDQLRAVVGFKDVQANYLALQEEGGSRSPKRKLIALPGAIEKNQYGNLTPSLLRRLYLRAKANKRATKGLLKSLKTGSDTRLFIGSPRGGNRAIGIWARTNNNQRLLLLVAFTDKPVRYGRSKLEWTEFATQQARRQLPDLFRKNLADALATAR